MSSTGMLKAEYGRMADVESRMWWYTSLHACLLTSIRERFQADTQIRILDAGCGTGGFLRYLRDRGYDNSVGLDIADLAVEASRNQGFEVIQGSISDPATLQKAGKADVIVSMDVICSLPDEAERVVFLQEATTLLNDRGLLIIQTPAFSCLRGIHDRAVGVNRRYSKSSMHLLLKQAGIKHYRLRYRLTLLTPLILLVRSMQRLRLKLGRNVPIESDVRMPPAFINTLLASLQRFEDRHLAYRPFGTSLQILVTKRDGKA
jgi:SAM-dependent methyltransferase